MTAIRYELTRLRTVRATWATAAGVLAVGAAATWVEARDLGATPAAADHAAQVITSGAPGAATPLAAVVVAFAAVLSCAREQRRGHLETLLLVLPRRGRALAAKTVVTAVLAGCVAVLSLAVNALVADAVFGSEFRALAWDQVPVPRLLAGYVAYLVLAAVLGLAVGILTRGSAAAAVAVATLPWTVEPLVGRAADAVLAEPYRDWDAYLPFSAADRMLSTGAPGLAPGTGAVVFGCWVAAALLGAAIVFARRDAV
ncbi:ABC transporter permease [Yinghuangia sp. YIM S10712]|uniref:ABC transporter permease n=1 Tax=Yinghuangia sp. YIM S10712 TaxID=3436930 RepID=UPI003F531497